jgi:hypothetical protein
MTVIPLFSRESFRLVSRVHSSASRLAPETAIVAPAFPSCLYLDQALVVDRLFVQEDLRQFP